MDAFLQTYSKLQADTLHLLHDIYSPDIHFIDPAHELRGIVNLEKYFRNLYANLTFIQFEFLHPQCVAEQGYVQWIMTYAHPRLNGGSNVSVSGATFLQFEASGKACIHRDYFDLGAMLYQQLPLLGPLVRSIKRRLGR